MAAMRYAVGRLRDLPISSRLIWEAHGILLAGVRGQHKLPGELPRLLSDLERFANDETNPIPDLLRMAILHY